MNNPFHTGQTVKGSSFFGRKEQLAEIKKKIESAKQNSLVDPYTAISGRRRYGKTSLLEHTAIQDFMKDTLFLRIEIGRNINSYNELVDKFVLSFQEKYFKHLEESNKHWSLDYIKSWFQKTFKIEFNQYGISLQKDSSKFLNFPKDVWTPIKQNSKGSLKSLVIVFDEMDYLLEESKVEFAKDLAGNLKLIGDCWRTEHKDVFVLLSCLAPVYDALIKHHSSFASHFHSVNVGPFTDQEFDQFFAEKLQQIGVKTGPSFLEKTSQVTKRIPYFMQLLGYYAVNLNRDEILDDQDFQNALEKALGAGGQIGEGVGPLMLQSINQIKDLKFATRTLREMALIEKEIIPRAEIIEKVKASFDDPDYEIDSRYENREKSEGPYTGDQQVSNVLDAMLTADLIERPSKGNYKISTPFHRAWINLHLNQLTIQDVVAKNKSA